jgi:hypothetical protein
MANRVSLDDVTPDQFDLLAHLLSETIADRRVKIRLWVPSSVELRFDSAAISDLLDSWGLPVGACLSQLNADIPVMIAGVLSGRQVSATGYLATETQLTEPGLVTEESEDREDLIRTELLERCAILESRVIDEELRRQYAVKTTAKNRILIGTEWEVVKRQSDDTGTLPPLGLTYATVRFILQKPPISYVRYVGLRQESETVTAILTAEEIVELRDSLNQALAAIEQARQHEEGS